MTASSKQRGGRRSRLVLGAVASVATAAFLLPALLATGADDVVGVAGVVTDRSAFQDADGSAAFDLTDEAADSLAAQSAGPVEAFVEEMTVSDVSLDGFVALDVDDADAEALLNAVNPASELIPKRGAGTEAPTRSMIIEAVKSLESALSLAGFDGTFVAVPQWGVSFRGLAPEFSRVLDAERYRIDIDVYPSAEGTLEGLAKQELVRYSMLEEDLPTGTKPGSVWTNGQVAYGHNVGQDPDEWAAIDLGRELYFLRVHHRGDVSAVIGRVAFLKAAVATIETVQAVGMTRSPTADAAAFRGKADLAEALSVAINTQCGGDLCGPIQATE